MACLVAGGVEHHAGIRVRCDAPVWQGNMSGKEPMSKGTSSFNMRIDPDMAQELDESS